MLFIASDDLRPQLGCYGHAKIKSPNIDKLASQGLRFDRAYCQQAVCAPTRASLLTGTRPDTTRVYDLQTPLNTVRPDLVSIPHHFRKHGYETISLGKIYHHETEDPLGWSAPPWRVRGGRGDDYWRYLDPVSLIGVRQNDAALRAAYERDLKSGKKVAPSRFGRGAAFEVFLPEAVSGDLSNEIRSGGEPGGHERILFVDDEELVVQLGEKMLKSLGYEVTSRYGSVEALDTVRVEPRKYDLVITDMTMPDMTGLRLAEQIHGMRPELPVILCTGYSEFVNEAVVGQYGIRCFMTKPYSRADLAAAVRRALDTRRAP